MTDPNREALSHWDSLEAEPDDDDTGISIAEALEIAKEMREDFELQVSIKKCALLQDQAS